MSRLMIADINNPRTQTRVLLNVRDTLNNFIKNTGVEVTDVSLEAIRVIKHGENQTINIFQQLLSSDVGKQLLGALGSQAVELLAEHEAEIQTTSTRSSFDQPSLSSASTIPISSLHPAEVPSNATLDSLVDQIRRCCDANLVAKIGKYYRIQCELDGRVYAIDLNLQCGDGYCTMAAPDERLQPPSDVTFSLTYTTLIALIRGEISPVSAYLNGNVRITGSVEDAMALNHLAARAKELNLKLV